MDMAAAPSNRKFDGAAPGHARLHPKQAGPVE
jgi:hypothetical protein